VVADALENIGVDYAPPKAAKDLRLHDLSWRGQAGDIEDTLAVVTSKLRKAVNSFDSLGLTPLHYACRTTTATAGPDTARILLLHGADPRQVDNRGLTCLHVAASRGDAATVRLLADAVSGALYEEQKKAAKAKGGHWRWLARYLGPLPGLATSAWAWVAALSGGSSNGGASAAEEEERKKALSFGSRQFVELAGRFSPHEPGKSKPGPDGRLALELALEALGRVKESQARVQRRRRVLARAEEELEARHEAGAEAYHRLHNVSAPHVAALFKGQTVPSVIDPILKLCESTTPERSHRLGGCLRGNNGPAWKMPASQRSPVTAVWVKRDWARMLPPFLRTVRGGSLQAVKAQLGLPGLDGDQVAGPCNMTALHVAAQGRSVDVFLMLMAWRPQLLSRSDELGCTPLHYLAYQALGWKGGWCIHGDLGLELGGLTLEEVVTKAGRGVVAEDLMHLPDNRGNTVLALDVLRMAQVGAEWGVLKARMAQLHDRSEKDTTLRPEALGAAELLVRHGLNQALALLLEAKHGLDINTRWPERSLTKRPAAVVQGHDQAAGDQEEPLPPVLTFQDPPYRGAPVAPSTCLLKATAGMGQSNCLMILLEKGAKPHAQDVPAYVSFLHGAYPSTHPDRT
jgi:hypothetical protein